MDDLTNTTIFIDAGYLTAVSNKKGIKINYVKLSKELSIGVWKKTIVYNALPRLDDKRYPKTQKFHSALRKLDKIEVKLGRLQYSKNDIPRQKGVDMKIGIDLVQMSMNKEFTNAVLISADSDFLYAVQKAQEVGIHVTLAHFPGSSINAEFLKSFDGYILLHDEFLDKCKL